MQATTPHTLVPGDNELQIMARSGTCVGLSNRLAVWRFGYVQKSLEASDHMVSIEENNMGHGFLWILATRKTGKIKDRFRGYAVELPTKYRQVLDWEP